VYDKKHFCLYCGKGQSKISRHLQKSHQDEREVLALEKTAGKPRAAQLDKLRNLGNHLHNVEVLKENKGVLIVGQRPKKDQVQPKAADYSPCPLCYVSIF
jgi:hypothetical protein